MRDSQNKFKFDNTISFFHNAPPLTNKRKLMITFIIPNQSSYWTTL